MHVHPKASGLEAHASNYVGGSRKKPPNPDEVGAIKDHFSDGRQQDNRRQQPKRGQSPQPEDETTRFNDVAVAERSLDESQKQAALALYALAKKAAPQAGTHGDTVRPAPADEPSLNDLLALMRGKL